MIAFDSLLMKFSHQTNSTTANFRSPYSIEGKCLIDLLTRKHFPNAKRKIVLWELNLRFLSSAAGVLPILIRKPLGIKKNQNEYYLAVPNFIIRIVQRMQTSFFHLVEYFNAWLRNEGKDFKVVVRHSGYLLEELHFFLNVSLFTVPVRLTGVDGVNYAGRVEVFYQGKWGKVCRNEWDINDVKVVCRQLGFQSALAEFLGTDTRDENISFVMSNVACTGQESVLASCKRRQGKHQCWNNIEAQALCEPSKWNSTNV